MTLSARASSAVTITLASLATSSGLTVGRCSASFDNSTNLDEMVAASLLCTTGTTPTTATRIELWAFQQREDGTWPDIFTAAYTGSDGGFTIQSRDILRAGAALVGSVATDATSNRAYVIGMSDIAARLGGFVRIGAFFVVHSTGVNLNSTAGNHELVVKTHYWA